MYQIAGDNLALIKHRSGIAGSPLLGRRFLAKVGFTTFECFQSSVAGFIVVIADVAEVEPATVNGQLLAPVSRISSRGDRSAGIETFDQLGA